MNIRKASIKLDNINELIYIVAPTTIIKWIQRSIDSDLIFKDHYKFIDNKDVNPNLESVYAKFIVQDDPSFNFVDVELQKFEKMQEKYIIFKEIVKKNEKIFEFYNYLEKFLGINLYSIEVF